MPFVVVEMFPRQEQFFHYGRAFRVYSVRPVLTESVHPGLTQHAHLLEKLIEVDICDIAVSAINSTRRRSATLCCLGSHAVRNMGSIEQQGDCRDPEDMRDKCPQSIHRALSGSEGASGGLRPSG